MIAEKMPKRRTDTRALVRQAFPHILAMGANPSVAKIKAYVREQIGKDDWNPSSSTVDGELEACRVELGKKILAGEQLGALPPHLIEPTLDFIVHVFELLRGEARSELHEQRAAAHQAATDANIAAEKAAVRATEAERLRQTEAEQHERHQIRWAADLSHALEKIEVQDKELRTLKEQLAEQRARNAAQAEEIVRLSTERQAEGARHAELIKLADERYRDLEHRHHQEFDNARQSAAKALSEADRLRNALTEAQLLVAAKSVEAAGYAGEIKGLRSQVEGAESRAKELETKLFDARVAAEATKSEVSKMRIKIDELQRALATERTDKENPGSQGLGTA